MLVAQYPTHPKRSALMVSITALLILALLPLQEGRAGVPASVSVPPASDQTEAGTTAMAFEANVGQADARVQFTAHTREGGALFFGDSEVTLAPAPPRGGSGNSQEISSLSLQFMDASRGVTLQAGDPLPGTVNYLLGNDPAKWRTGLHTYASIVYRTLYPGIDLVYTGKREGLKGTYTVAPHASPSDIRWRYAGTSSTSVDADGNLRIEVTSSKLKTQNSELTERAPVAWQEIGSRREAVMVRYEVAVDGSVSFAVGAYDAAYPLVIDPTLDFSTYLGGTGQDSGTGIAVDAAGNTYVTGDTRSADFPLNAPYQPTNGGGQDAFVAKFNAAGTQLVYATYLGGSGLDGVWSIFVDATGSAYVTGNTTSPNFPVANAFQAAYGGVQDAFVARLNPEGNGLIYSTYLGGSQDDWGWSVAEVAGSIYVAGRTSSSDFPIVNAYQPTLRGSEDGFVTRISPDGHSLVYSTYLGGSGLEEAQGIGVDAAGNVYVTGDTNSTDFPVANAFEPASGGAQDVFLTKFNPNGVSLGYSTYLGGGGDDDAWAMAVTPGGEVYLTGYTGSLNFPTLHAVQPSLVRGFDAFVTRFNAAGSGLVYSTYLGGNGGYDAGYGIAVDGRGNAYISGITNSTNFPVRNAIQGTSHGSDEAFVTMLQGSEGSLEYSTYLGGTLADYAFGVAVSSAGSAYVAGQSASSDFPTVNAFQPAHAGSLDVFVAKIAEPCAISFSDVQPNDYYYVPVTYLYCHGVINGYADGTFRPGSNTTRAQLTKMVVLSEGWPLNTAGGPHFSDVPGTDPFYAYVETAYNRRVINGYADGTFRPGNDVTREQLSKIEVNARGWTLNTAGGPHFSDVPPAAPLYAYVETAYNRQVVSGYADGTFRPRNPATRGQISKIVYNALNSPQ